MDRKVAIADELISVGHRRSSEQRPPKPMPQKMKAESLLQTEATRGSSPTFPFFEPHHFVAVYLLIPFIQRAMFVPPNTTGDILIPSPGAKCEKH
jgi:hypothetical protein